MKSSRSGSSLAVSRQQSYHDHHGLADERCRLAASMLRYTLVVDLMPLLPFSEVLGPKQLE